MKRLMVLAVAAAMVCLSAGNLLAFGTSKFEKEVTKEAGAVKLLREVQRGGYDVITTDELKKMMDDKADFVLVDTMPLEASYNKAHVPGAVQFLFPIPDMNTWNSAETAGKSMADYEGLLGADKEKPVIVYCGFVKCTRSHNGATWAVKLGYQNVYRFPGGIFAWKGADYPAAEVK